MEDNKKSQDQPHMDDPNKTNLSEHQINGENSSMDTKMNDFDSDGEDFINLTEIVDDVEEDEIPIELEDVVALDEPGTSPALHQTVMGDDGDDFIDLMEIVPAEQLASDDARQLFDAGSEEDDELIELTDTVSVDEFEIDAMPDDDLSTKSDSDGDTEDIVDLTDIIELEEPVLESPALGAVPEDVDEIIELTDTVWPEETEETEEADEEAPSEPAVAEFQPTEPSADEWGDAFIDITDIDLTDFSGEEEASISSAVDEDGEEEILELSDDLDLETATDLSAADQADVFETADEELSPADMIEDISIPDEGDERAEEEIFDLAGIIEPIESDADGSLENVAEEDLSDLNEYIDQPTMEAQDELEILPETDEQDGEPSFIELTERVDEQKPVILLEDEIVSPQYTLLEEIDAVLSESGPSTEEIMESRPEELIPISEEPMVKKDERQEAPSSEDMETSITPEWDTALDRDMEPAPAAADIPEINSDQDKNEDVDQALETGSVLDIEMLESMMSDTFSGDNGLINLDDVLGRRQDDTAPKTVETETIETDLATKDDTEPAAGKSSDDFTIGIALNEIDLENEGMSVSQEEIESAVERVIQKKYGRNIEQLVATTVEKMVRREIESIRRSMLEDEDPTD